MSKDERKTSPYISCFLGILCYFILLLADQVTKKMAVLYLKGRAPVTIIKNVFQLYYLENHGAAFGILQGKSAIFICITLVILALIVFFYIKIPFDRKYHLLRVLMILIAAGAVGNFIDRISRKYVVDFFYFCLIDFPVFNVADIYVTCATVLLVLAILFRYKEEDIQEILTHTGLNKHSKHL